ncbi:MAG: hypothetical protein O3B01_04595 [Planctomycetota bacterium]|nr:hypothetical protein [Planctomycetota bacterium]MDA1137841.1 hypothetical protein [Planctomycetota bacterium]
MLPQFNENGYLPPGLHRCTFEELSERFGSGSPEREVEIKELEEFVAEMTHLGEVRMIVNGSFVTASESPNDVDIVLLPMEDAFNFLRARTLIEDRQWPFLQIMIAADFEDLDQWVSTDFGTDRDLKPKGVVELIL